MRLTPPERAFRKALLDLIVRRGRPVSPTELAEATGLTPQESAELTNVLQAKRLLVRNPAGEIAFVYPVSALPTAHRVTLADGRAFYAMCGIDALGCAFEFGQDIAIASVCGQCRDPLSVVLRGGKLSRAEPDTIQLLHVDLDQYTDWAASC